VASAAYWNRKTVIVWNKRPNSDGLYPRTLQYAWHPAHLRSQPQYADELARKKDEQNPKLEKTLLPAQPKDIVEVDEMWSFVLEHWQKRWIWTAMCRRTRQIIAYAIGDRSQKTCLLLWERIPAS
jgi:IS1 transposase